MTDEPPFDWAAEVRIARSMSTASEALAEAVASAGSIGALRKRASVRIYCCKTRVIAFLIYLQGRPLLWSTEERVRGNQVSYSSRWVDEPYWRPRACCPHCASSVELDRALIADLRATRGDVHL